MSTELHHMSEDQLEHMIQNAQRLLEEKQKGKRQEVIAQIRKLAASAGLEVTITTAEGGKVKSARKGSRVAPKYRNPNDPNETWTGRGVKPKWLRALLEQGRNQDDFKI